VSAGTAAALVLQVDVAAGDAAELEAWHGGEHLAERIACPGWQRGARYLSLDRPSRFLLFYDTASLAAFESAAYRARLDDPTPWSRRVFPRFRDTWRTPCTVERRHGGGLGGAALLLRPDGEAPFDALVAAHAVRVDLLAGHAPTGALPSTEKTLRAAPDRHADRVLIAFFASDEAARSARGVASGAELFGFRQSLARSDLS